MIAITLVAGVALIGWVNTQAASSENALGTSAVKQANFYKESFVIVGVQFYYETGGSAAPSCYVASNNYIYCNQISVAVYNNGAIGLTITNIQVTGSTPTMSLSASYSPSSGWCSSGAPCTYTCGPGSGSIPPAVDTTTPGFVTISNPAHLSNPSQTLQGSVPPTVYTLTLPQTVTGGTGTDTCTAQTTQWFQDGASYSVQLTGMYGNVVTTQVTANG